MVVALQKINVVGECFLYFMDFWGVLAPREKEIVKQNTNKKRDIK